MTSTFSHFYNFHSSEYKQKDYKNCRFCTQWTIPAGDISPPIDIPSLLFFTLLYMWYNWISISLFYYHICHFDSFRTCPLSQCKNCISFVEYRCIKIEIFTFQLVTTNVLYLFSSFRGLYIENDSTVLVITTSKVSCAHLSESLTASKNSI